MIYILSFNAGMRWICDNQTIIFNNMQSHKDKNLSIHTDEAFMLSLNWDQEILEQSKKFLNDWDKRRESFYKEMSKLSVQVDKAEREHLRNTIKFYEERFENENRQTRDS